jgi:hypothetical protein
MDLPPLLASVASDRLHDLVQVERAWLHAWREFLEALEPLPDVRGCRGERVHILDVPAPVVHPDVLAQLERIHAQVGQHGGTHGGEGFLPDVKPVMVLAEKGDLPVVVAERRDAAVVGPVDELVARHLPSPLNAGSRLYPST